MMQVQFMEDVLISFLLLCPTESNWHMCEHKTSDHQQRPNFVCVYVSYVGNVISCLIDGRNNRTVCKSACVYKPFNVSVYVW